MDPQSHIVIGESGDSWAGEAEAPPAAAQVILVCCDGRLRHSCSFFALFRNSLFWWIKCGNHSVRASLASPPPSLLLFRDNLKSVSPVGVTNFRYWDKRWGQSVYQHLRDEDFPSGPAVHQAFLMPAPLKKFYDVPAPLKKINNEKTFLFSCNLLQEKTEKLQRTIKQKCLAVRVDTRTPWNAISHPQGVWAPLVGKLCLVLCAFLEFVVGYTFTLMSVLSQ